MLWSYRILVLVGLGVTLAGCAHFNDRRGVEVTWQPAAMEQLEKGKTTRRDVLTTFGPPSQIISLGEETVLYYLYEKTAGEGLVLIVYNRIDVQTRYDRAVFFFDANDLLTEYASHISAAPDPKVDIGG